MVFIVVLCNIEPSCFALDWFSGVWVGHVVVLRWFSWFGVSDSLRFGCCYDIVLVVFGFCVWVWFLIVAGALGGGWCGSSCWRVFCAGVLFGFGCFDVLRGFRILGFWAC